MYLLTLASQSTVAHRRTLLLATLASVGLGSLFFVLRRENNRRRRDSSKRHRSLPRIGFHKVTADIGPNPNDVSFYSYVPAPPSHSLWSYTVRLKGLLSKVVSKNQQQYGLGLVVALHYCTGSAEAYFEGTKWASLADKHRGTRGSQSSGDGGFIVIFGDSPREGKCWDVSSPETLKHDAGGDSLGIANMVRYAIENWDIDPEQVFVTGHSSGAMMTNVMIGAYPELFKAGASSAGVPFGAFATHDGSSWNVDCALGKILKSGEEWANFVRSAYPTYSGVRPSIQLWHGTKDDILSYVNFEQAVKQWTHVLGVQEVPKVITKGDPVPGITRASYSNKAGARRVEAYSVEGGPHNIEWHENRMLEFFGLLKGERSDRSDR